ncbi:DUF2971 domain-containing protein [Pseudomonas sp. PS02303]|uniref:DUF2971 domain-containing protein n=1 Tax=Pseudomonas sp. PS02303 TaxID=2991429 RepID=UPI00249BE694|nr:DUF2971 domain-containing protein [Pseudomonas sp. PS02303]
MTKLAPQQLYKYRDDSERTEEIIKSQKVWLSTPAQLNDPLECRIGEIPKEWEERTIRDMENAQLMGIFGFPPKAPKTLFSLSEIQTKKWLEKFKTSSHDQRISDMRELHSNHGMQLSNPKDIFLDMRKRLLSVGVFSLSEDCQSELMWAHYGANHEGVAIGFAASPHCKLGNFRHTIPVEYTAQKPNFKSGFKSEVQIFSLGSGQQNIVRVSFEDEVFRAALSTKTPIWQYEKEWRYVEESHGLYDAPGRITTMVFGLRMNSDRKKHYKNLASEFIPNEVHFFEVSENSNLSGYEIVEA